jgi:hypothetical protein
MECMGWEWRPRACAYPSEVDIKIVGNRENKKECTNMTQIL